VVKDVCRKSKFTFMLSGTPIVAQPEEMWSYLHIFAPDRFPTLRDFKRKYAGMQNIAGEYQWAVDAHKLLSQGMKGQMIRRRVDEVGIEMPELTEIIRTLEMTGQQRKLYDQLRKQFWIWLDEQEGKALTAMAIIAQLIRLRQINTWPAGIKLTDPDTKKVTHLDLQESAKVDEAMDIITEFIDAEESVVISCTFNGPLLEVQRRCEELMIPCDVLTGETKDETGVYAERFRQNKGRVLCLNSAMGEGLNLHKMPDRWPGGSRVIVHLDKWYTPARNEQVERRIYRLGIKEGAIAYYLRCEESVDDFLDAILAERMEMIGSIVESDQVRPSGDWKSFLQGKI
jgi:SNF2 family DNA or RNA helicase